MKGLYITSFMAAMVILIAFGASGQTTGTLIGNVTTDGVPLPGATVTVSSDNLQGVQEPIKQELASVLCDILHKLARQGSEAIRA